MSDYLSYNSQNEKNIPEIPKYRSTPWILLGVNSSNTQLFPSNRYLIERDKVLIIKNNTLSHDLTIATVVYPALECLK